MERRDTKPAKRVEGSARWRCAPRADRPPGTGRHRCAGAVAGVPASKAAQGSGEPRTAETEHHEIAVYEGLIINAWAMGRDDVVRLLEQNLEQEQHTLDEVKQSLERVATVSPAAEPHPGRRRLLVSGRSGAARAGFWSRCPASDRCARGGARW